MPKSEAFLMDCMDYMKTLPDKAFDLAVVDPPYGDAKENKGGWNRFGERFAKYRESNSKHAFWDVAPPQEYFDELFRVSKNQIIWGGNYFRLPPTRCFLIWRKTCPETFSLAIAEYAWTSFNANAKVFEHAAMGTPQDPRFHPTQKPVKLYEWIFAGYAKPGDRILDTHLGSGSSRIAAYEAGLDFVGTEISEYYFEKQEERFRAFSSQLSLFNDDLF